jgi:hypothetical protein
MLFDEACLYKEAKRKWPLQPMGALCHYWIKRRARFKRNILSRKDARLCMELTALERQLWRLQNCKDIICACPRTNATGETKMKFHTGNAPDSEGAVFQCLLICLWMRQEWACAFCLFPEMSEALWCVCRHIIGRLTIRDYIYLVSRPVSCVRNL